MQRSFPQRSGVSPPAVFEGRFTTEVGGESGGLPPAAEAKPEPPKKDGITLFVYIMGYIVESLASFLLPKTLFGEVLDAPV